MGELETKFGDLLKLERERQGLRIEDLAESLRISAANLNALEAGDPAALPSPVYFNLFSKTYAEALGIDYAATMDAIKADINERTTPDQKKPKKSKQPPPKAEAEAPAPAPTPVAETMPDHSEPEPTAPKKKGRGLMLTGSLAAALAILLGGYLIVTQLLITTDPSEVSAASSSTRENAYKNYNWSVPRYEPSDSLRLTLQSRGDSWATILTDGDTAIFRNLLPGATYQVSARYRMLVSIAVPQMVNVDLNGHTVDLLSPETGRVSRVEITQVNLDSIFNPVRQDTTDVLLEPDTANPAGAQGNAPAGITGDTTQHHVGGA